MKTLQQQYNLIKEGKGDKNFFLRQALRQFPEWITVNNTFDQTVSILKGKSILSEAVDSIVTQTSVNPFVNWEKFLNEETNKSKGDEVDYDKMHNVELNATYKEKFGVKDTKGLTRDKLIKALKSGKAINEAKAEEKKPTKEVVDTETKGFDYKDEKNIDNLYGQSFLLGYIAEMNNPKNAEKTVDELKNIVAKNMEKDPNYYIKNAMFGVEGLKGEQLETPKEVKGKFTSSGMEPYKLKENMIKLTDLLLEEYSKEKPKKSVKKESVDSKLAEIEKAGKITTLEAQIEVLDELIEGKTQRLSMISEDEDLSEIADKNKIKEMQREVKELQKRKMKMEKLYEKMCGKSYSKPKIVDEEKAEKGNVDESVVKENLKDLSKMSIEQLNQLYQDLEDEMYNELSMDGSGELGGKIMKDFEPLFDRIEDEINSRSGALSPVRADDFPLDKDDTDPRMWNRV